MKYSELIQKIKDNTGYLNEIEVKNYLPTNAKMGFASMIARSLLDEVNGILRINSLKAEMFKDFLVFNYTDIEKDGEYSVDDYDVLKEHGFFDAILNKIEQQNRVIGTNDYYNLINQLEENADILIYDSKRENTGINGTIKNSINSVFDKIVAIYSTKDGKKQINSFLKELNKNTELLDTVNNVMIKFNLDLAKDELLRRIKEASKERPIDIKDNKIEENKE